MIIDRRRKLMSAALAGVALCYQPGWICRTLAQAKMSKREAEYQDRPKDIRMCATCTLFEPPMSCKIVEGDISPNGWCKAFALAD